MTDHATEEQGWDTARTLAEALPYIQIYDRETVVIGRQRSGLEQGGHRALTGQAPASPRGGAESGR